ncbi:hypothetical protein ACHQM5_028999 [Ranunculus cassubicifolius]
MSSWLSLNPFKSDQEPPSESNGVQQDLSEIRKTLTKQIWGVASFLAPPPPSSPSIGSNNQEFEESQTLVGIRKDFAEISGSLKNGFSKISGTKAVNEITRLASNILQFDEGGDDDDQESEEEEEDESEVVGVTEEVLEFIEEISVRQECWIDFPISLNDYDFDMSNVQKDHVSAVEHFCPSLIDLRMKLCPSHLREEHFWMIYFILLHPRLNKHDSEILSTSQIVEARDTLLKTMQTRKNAHLQTPEADDVDEKDSTNNVPQEPDVVPEREALPKTESGEQQDDADVDQWLEEEQDVTGPGTSYTGQTHIGNEQDVSFSDLEDDDSDSLSRQGRTSTTEKPNESPGWVQLSENSDNGGSGRKKGSRGKDSEGDESNEWLTIDEFDSDNNTGTAS